MQGWHHHHSNASAICYLLLALMHAGDYQLRLLLSLLLFAYV